MNLPTISSLPNFPPSHTLLSKVMLPSNSKQIGFYTIWFFFSSLCSFVSVVNVNGGLGWLHTVESFWAKDIFILDILGKLFEPHANITCFVNIEIMTFLYQPKLCLCRLQWFIKSIQGYPILQDCCTLPVRKWIMYMWMLKRDYDRKNTNYFEEI